MPDAVLIEFASGMDAEQYDRMDEAIDPAGNPPEGLILHTAADSPSGGWRILDIWESRDHFDRFFEQRVQPAMLELLGEEALSQGEPPEITSWTLHNHVNLGR